MGVPRRTLSVDGTQNQSIPQINASLLSLGHLRNIFIEIGELGSLTMEFIAQLEGGFSRPHASKVQARTNVLLGYSRIYGARDIVKLGEEKSRARRFGSGGRRRSCRRQSAALLFIGGHWFQEIRTIRLITYLRGSGFCS
jgi:hypothetical protein